MIEERRKTVLASSPGPQFNQLDEGKAFVQPNKAGGLGTRLRQCTINHTAN